MLINNTKYKQTISISSARCGSGHLYVSVLPHHHPGRYSFVVLCLSCGCLGTILAALVILEPKTLSLLPSNTTDSRWSSNHSLASSRWPAPQWRRPALAVFACSLAGFGGCATIIHGFNHTPLLEESHSTGCARWHCRAVNRRAGMMR